MFLLGKLLTLITLPTALMVEALLLGALLSRTRYARAGRALRALALLALAACLVLPIDGWAIRPLEDRFPRTEPLLAIGGIVVLGGAIDEITSRDRGAPVLTAAAGRLTAFVALARRYPDARLVFTGGSGAIVQGIGNEAFYARQLLDSLGLPPSRITFEDRSRTTWENAVDSAALVHPRSDLPWLLITSAAHMPRAVGAFRRAGWNVVPWPAGYRSRDRLVSVPLSLGQRLATLDEAAHEWLGLVAYRLAGHSDALFPGPSPRTP